MSAITKGNLQEASRYAPFLSDLDKGAAENLSEQMSRIDAWEVLEAQVRRRSAQVRVRIETEDGSTQILFPLRVKKGSWVIENEITYRTTIERIPAEPTAE